LELERLILVTPHFEPEITACAYRMVSFKEALSKKFDVKVLALGPIGVEVTTTYSEVTYISQHKYNSDSLISRFLWEFFYSLKLVVICCSANSKKIVVTSPYLALVICFGFLKIVTGRYVHLDLRDITWEYIETEPYTLKGFIKNLLQKTIFLFLPRFDSISVTNQSEKKYLEENIPGIKIITVIQNGISRQRFDTLINLKEKPISEELIVLYVGTVGIAQQLDILLDLAKIHFGLTFWIVGDGVEREKLEARAEKLKLNNLKFFGKVPQSEMSSFYERADILYGQIGTNCSYAIPSKLYEYLACRKPVIFGAIGAVVDYCRDLDTVFVIAPNDPEEFKKALRQVLDKRSLFDYETQIHHIREGLREISGNSLVEFLQQR